MQTWEGRHKEVARILDDAAPDVSWASELSSWVLERDEAERSERLLALVEVLEADEPRRTSSGAALHQLLRTHSAARLLAEAGLSTEHGFLSEAANRLARRLLPEAPEAGELGPHLQGPIRREAEAQAVSTLPIPLVRRLLVAWRHPFQHQLEAVRRSVGELAIRLAAIGLSPPVARRLDERQRESFVALARQASEFAASRAPWSDCAPALEGCRGAIASVTGNLESSGVSVALVFRLECLERGLARLEALAAVAESPSLEAGLSLFASVAEASWRERSIRALARRNLRLLARRIAEHSGDTGEHYIAPDRRAWRAMLIAAAGGGVLTAGTTAGKYGVAGLSLALFPDALLNGIVYAGSFLVMQLLGLTLATKQPAMTAAALARSLRSGDAGSVDGLVDLTASIARSQVAAAAGNLGAVIPAALILDLLVRRSSGAAFLSEETAAYVLHSLQPFASGTLFFAALTGVLLWLSSLAAGAVHNWAVVRRLPEGIAASEASRKWLGRRGAAWVGRRLEHGIGGIAGNTTLGALLALTPMAGRFLGLPLDVRHVTLSTGALTLAACALGPEALFSWEGLGAAAGIGAIALLNFGVSFLCALRVAFRAQGVDGEARRALWRALLRRFRQRPREFLLPPPPEPALPVAAPDGGSPG